MIHLANASERSWTKHNFVFAFGAYGDTLVRAWGRGVEDALDAAVDWISENKPGLLANKEVASEYNRLRAEGKSEEEAIREAEVDTTTAGNAGNYIHSCEWQIVAENPSREDILRLQGRA